MKALQDGLPAIYKSVSASAASQLNSKTAPAAAAARSSRPCQRRAAAAEGGRCCVQARLNQLEAICAPASCKHVAPNTLSTQCSHRHSVIKCHPAPSSCSIWCSQHPSQLHQHNAPCSLPSPPPPLHPAAPARRPRCHSAAGSASRRRPHAVYSLRQQPLGATVRAEVVAHLQLVAVARDAHHEDAGRALRGRRRCRRGRPCPPGLLKIWRQPLALDLTAGRDVSVFC